MKAVSSKSLFSTAFFVEKKLSQKTNAVLANGEILFVTPKQQDNLIALIQHNTSLNVSYQGEFF